MRGAFLILSLSAGRADAYHFSRGGRNPRLLSHKTADIRDGKLEKGIFSKAPGRDFPGGVYVVLPSEELVLKRMHLPLRDEEKIRRVIRLEVEKHLPYPADEAVMDFAVAEKRKNGSDVFVAAARKKNLEVLTGILESSGLEPRAAVPDISGIPELAGESGPFMLVSAGETALKICVFKDGYPTVTKNVRLEEKHKEPGAGIESVIGEEAVLAAGVFSLREPGCALEKAFLACGGPGLEKTAGVLREKLGVETRVLDAFESMRHSLGPEEMESARGAHAAAGLARAIVSGKKVLNLKDIREKAARIESPRISAVLGIAVVLLVFSSVFLRLREKEAELSAVEARISAAVQETFGAPELAGRSGVEIISILRGRTELRGATFSALDGVGHDSPLDVLRELSLILGGGGVEVTGVRIDGWMCYLDGRSPSFRQVEEIFGRITDSQYFRGASISRAQVDSDRGGVVFRIEIELPRGYR